MSEQECCSSKTEAQLYNKPLCVGSSPREELGQGARRRDAAAHRGHGGFLGLMGKPACMSGLMSGRCAAVVEGNEESQP